jgi:hypothetical protein
MDDWEISNEEIEKALPDLYANWITHPATKAGAREDREHNVDLIVDGEGVALRGRFVHSEKHGCAFMRWSNEYSLRSIRPVWPAEEAKLVTGKSLSRWMVYYWVDKPTSRVVCGTLIDLIKLTQMLDRLPYQEIPNKKKFDSEFRVYGLEAAANRGAVLDHYHVDPSEFPWTEKQLWPHRQLINVIEAQKHERPPWWRGGTIDVDPASRHTMLALTECRRRRLATEAKGG